MVQLLLRHEKMNLHLGNENQEKFRPPLAISAGMSTKEVFEDILIGGKDIWKSSDYRTALIDACSHNKPDNVKVLLNHARDVLDNGSLELAMLSAAVEGNWSCVPLIFREGLACSDVFYLAAISEHGDVDTLLRDIWAVSGPKIPKEIVDAALYQATDNQKAPTVKWLLRNCGANANATDKFPAILHKDCLRSKPMESYGDALTAAAWDGTVEIVEELLKNGAVVDSVHGCALQMAAREGHAKVVDILLQNGADINRIPGEQKDYEGPPFADGTALQAACINGRDDVVVTLLHHKTGPADPNLGRGPFSRPILAATRSDRPEILRLLLDAPGIEVNVIDHENGLTPLINATEYMSADAVRMLISANADVNQPDMNGDTALAHAAHKGDAGTLQLLVDNNANFMYESLKYGFAFSDAASQGHVDCMRVFSSPISRIFRGLNNVIASGSVAVRDLVARPDDKHEIVDMEKVQILRTQVENFRQELQRIDSYRVGWAAMETKVHQAEADMLNSEQKMDAMRQERSEETSRIEKERESYSAAVHGFKKLQEENAKLEQRLAGHGNDLAALKQTHASEVEDARRQAAEYQEKLRTSRDKADEDRRLQANEIARLQGVIAYQQSTVESSSRGSDSQRESYRTNDSPSIHEDQEDGSANGEGGFFVVTGGKPARWKRPFDKMTIRKMSDNSGKS